ncbi:MAG: shikimate dehydrogenase [Alphaproteobacteria bacterium]|nr:shikimate dehydrogenase [Alphaproteobacteria bacterium]
MKNTIKTGLIGHPVSHSKSPLIHCHWIEKYGLLGSYDSWDVQSPDLEKTVRARVQDRCAGFNVTLPYKKSMLALCDDIDTLARTVGAVNTVTIRAGRVEGTNTDVFGFLENIRAHVPAFDFKAGPAAILGAGGAARAVVHGLLHEGIPAIRLLNRTREKAEALRLACIAPDRITVMDWDDRADALEGLEILVNTTALGMNGHPPLDIHLGALPSRAVVNDIVYTPLYTDLLKKARSRGNNIITGAGMLLHQARPAFKLWFGILPDIDENLTAKILS